MAKASKGQHVQSATFANIQEDIRHFAKHEGESLSQEEQSKLFKMKREKGVNDEIMNLFKLKLYNWNVNDALKYYKYDRFCLEYCIRKNYQYGCNKKQCPYTHSLNVIDLVFGNSKKRDYKQGELLCLYLMYKKMYHDNNPELFHVYAWILMQTGKSQQDYLKSEMYFLKALAIDNNYSVAHNNYAMLLKSKLKNYDKAERHYNQVLKINPNNAMSHCNFAAFLISKRHKYQLALSSSEKACKLKPNLSVAHYRTAQSLFKLNRLDSSVKEYQKCLTLNKKDGILSPNQVQDAKEKIAMHMQSRTAADTSTDEKSSQLTDQIVVEFDKLSIIDAMDQIVAQLFEIEQSMDNNDNIDKASIKNDLAIVRNKVSKTRTKCSSIDRMKNDNELSISRYNYSQIKSQIDQLNNQLQINVNDSSLSMLITVKKLEQEAKTQHQQMEAEFVQLCSDIDNLLNNLDGNNVVDSFEQKWCEWSIDDTTKWFEFVFSCNYKIEDYSSSSDSSDEDDDDEDETDEKKQEANAQIDFKHVHSRLTVVGFNAKKDLPVLVKPFQFKRFGFKNKKDCKLLFEKTKQLIAKYPRIKRKKKQKNDKVDLEGFVQDTN